MGMPGRREGEGHDRQKHEASATERGEQAHGIYLPSLALQGNRISRIGLSTALADPFGAESGEIRLTIL